VSPDARALHTLRINDGVTEVPTAATAPALDLAMFIGKTVLYNDESHGNQIEYYDPSGQAFLWYPGNERAAVGEWRRDKDGLEDGLCFRYPNSYNRVTHERGDEWRCQSFRALSVFSVDAVAGDAFGLGTGSVPFPLPASPPFDTVSQVKSAPR
jgi:hypothetical protein